MSDAQRDPRVDYWNHKIRKWARSSYTAERNDVLSKARSSIDARKEEAKKLLRTHMKPGFTMVDLGCGAGQLVLDAVQQLGASRATGRDFSAEAIQMAQELRDAAGIPAEAAQFEVAGVEKPVPDADVVTGLGLLDWLEPSQIEQLIASLRGRKFILSYSEQDNSFDEIVHRVWLVWRLKFRSGVRAYHHRRTYIFDLLNRAGITNVQQVSTPAMRFGRLIHNLGDSEARGGPQ